MVSVVIVNYNTFQYVLDCIESIKINTIDLKYEIIVVDNNSPNREIENYL
jgi:GT2 family glycosyltransferase